MAAPLALYHVPGDYDTLSANSGDADSFRLVAENGQDGYNAGSVTGMSGMGLISHASTPDEAVADVSSHSLSEGGIQVGIFVSASLNADAPILTLNGATHGLLRLSTINTTEHFMIETWNGSSWVQQGSDVAESLNTGFHKIDISFKIDGSTGYWRVYKAGSLVVEVAVGDTLVTDTTLDNIVISGASGSGTVAFAHLTVDDADTRRRRVVVTYSSNSGTYSEYDGAETSIDNSPTTNQSTYITFTDGERGTFPFFDADAAVLDTWTVDHVALIVHARGVDDPALNMQGKAYVSSTLYDGDDSVQPVAGANLYTHYLKLNFATNPNTAAAWADMPAVEAAEFGYEAVSA